MDPWIHATVIIHSFGLVAFVIWVLVYLYIVGIIHETDILRRVIPKHLPYSHLPLIDLVPKG